MKVKNLYRGCFNYTREVHILYVFAFSAVQAKEIMLRRLAHKHGVSLYWVRGLFNGQVDNFEVRLEVEFKESSECSPNIFTGAGNSSPPL